MNPIDFHNTPWAIAGEWLDQIQGALSSGPIANQAPRATLEIERLRFGVVILPVQGILMKRPSWLLSALGGTSTDELEAAFTRAINDSTVSSIILDIESPGGALAALGFADLIHQSRGRKPVIAVINEMALSGAYIIAAAADEVVCPATALVGDVGVAAVHTDRTAQEAMAGVKSTVFRAGRYKGAGNPHEALGADATECLQHRVDVSFSLVLDALARFRGSTGGTESETYVGEQAITAGLVDRIANLDTIVSELTNQAKPAAQAAGQIQNRDFSVMTETTAATRSPSHVPSTVISLSEDSPMSRFSTAGTNRLTFGASPIDKLASGIADALAIKFCGADGAAHIVPAGLGKFRLDPTPRQLSSDAYQLAGMGLLGMASELLRAHGVDVRSMNRPDIAKLVLSWKGLPSGFSASGGGEFHTTGDFPNLLRDASNKTLLLAYNEAPASFRQWVKIGEPAPDFKTIHRIALSGASDLEVVPEGKAFNQDQLSDRKESYAVETRGKAISFTREMLVNDDLDAFRKVMVRYGRAAERTINRVVYLVLTTNPAMADGVALFAAGHSNIITTGGTPDAGPPSVAQFNAMQKLMRTQTDPGNSDVIVNGEMAFLIAPAALEGTVLELLASTSNPASSNSGTANIWQSRVQPVIEPMLDSASASVYYGAADSRDVDTVEVTFLAGEEQPVIEQEFNFHTKGLDMTVHQTFGVKALDHVGMVRNAGVASG